MSGLINPTTASALQTLNSIETKLDRALLEAATGKAVGTVSDDPAAYVVASSLNSDAQALLAVRSGLGAAEVPTRVAAAAVNSASALLMKLQSTVFEAQPGGVAASASDTQIRALLSQIASNTADAAVNGINLIAGGATGDVKVTQISLPSNITGDTVTIGGKGLSQMNATLPGLGLDNFTATGDGISLVFSSLGVESIITAAPATRIEVQTANYNLSPDPSATPPVTGEAPQYPGQSWTFVFTDAATSSSRTDSNTVEDAAGNITHQDHVIPVPLRAGFSLSDALGALQGAMSAAGFVTDYGAQPLSGQPALSIAGNNVGAATVANLGPAFPIPIGQGSAVMTATTLPASPVVGSLSIPPGAQLSSIAGATYLSTPAEIAAYRSSNPTSAAFYLSPPSAGSAIAPGTTISSIDPVISVVPPAVPGVPPPPPPPPTYTIGLSPPATGTIPSSTLVLLVPLPSTPVVSTTVWGGVAGAVATLQSALRKTGDMGQALGIALNTLRQAQDNATQSADLLTAGVGNLTDADLGKVSAQILALQIQKQLAAQSLTLDNQAAGLLLQLFR